MQLDIDKPEKQKYNLHDFFLKPERNDRNQKMIEIKFSIVYEIFHDT